MSVRNALLGLLSIKPRHGYELRAAFEAVVGGDSNWEVKPAQIYTTLERLEEAGLVVRQSDLGEGDEPSRRIYEVTQAGIEALHEWFDSGVETQPQRDEFFVKLMIALACGKPEIWRIIQGQRASLYQELHALTAQRESYDPQREMAQILLLDKAIMHLEADLRWLDMAEMRTEVIKDQPLPRPQVRRRGRPRKEEQGSSHPPPTTSKG